MEKGVWIVYLGGKKCFSAKTTLRWLGCWLLLWVNQIGFAMKLFYLTSCLLLLCIFTSCGNKLSFTPSVVVARDGSGDYSSIQAAIDMAPDSCAERFIIYIKNGVYDTEKLIIPATKKNLVLVGEDRRQTVISYHIYDCDSPDSENKCPAESWALWKDNRELIRTSATLTIMADDCLLENLTISNTAGPVGQALAVTVRGNRAIFRECDLLGYQDTVYLPRGGKRYYFENCMILGRTDYIYGGAIAFFQSCEIRSFGGGWVTAPSTPEEQEYGFIFNECRFTYSTGSPRAGDDGELIAIGRPWHQYPKVAILNSEMCAEMDPKGWPTVWFMEYAATSDKLHLYEYNNSGPGADMTHRSAWAGLRSLTAEEAAGYTVDVLRGTDNWTPENISVYHAKGAGGCN